MTIESCLRKKIVNNILKKSFLLQDCDVIINLSDMSS